MAKGSIKTTPSFVCEIALAVSPAQERVLLSRLEAARQMYNACLGLSMRRVNLIRQSNDFNQGRSLKSSNPERKVLFKRARERYEFSDYAIQSVEWVATEVSTTVSKIQDVVGEIREPERGYPARRVGQSRTPLL